MLRISKFAVLAILGAMVFHPAFAADKPAALVNGVPIPQARVDFRVKAVVAQGQTDSPELRKAVRDDLINIEVMAQEAIKLGLNKSDEVLQETELTKQTVLFGALVKDYTKNHPISETQIKQEYDKLKTSLGDKEYNARHILVGTEAEAKSIIDQLGKKVKFEKLAEKSNDVASATKGGSLGWIVPSNFAPLFAKALLNLKKGEYTKEPVQAQFGWHVIMLDDIRELKIPPFDELKPQFQQRLQQQAIQKAIGDLRAKAKIE